MKPETPLSTIEKVMFLKSVDLFAGAAIEDLGRLAALMDEVRFEAGETILRAGELVEAIYFLVHGRVAIEKDTLLIRELGEKQAFAIVAALDQEPALHTVVARDSVRVLRLNAQDFHDMLSVDYELVRTVFRALCAMIRKIQ